MAVQITVELPEGVFSSLRQSPQDFVGKMRLAAAVKWYEMGTLTQGKAAEVAGLSRAEFIQALSQFGVSPFQASASELAGEVA